MLLSKTSWIARLEEPWKITTFGSLLFDGVVINNNQPLIHEPIYNWIDVNPDPCLVLTKAPMIR